MLGSGNYVSGLAQPLLSTLETWDSREMVAMKCAGRNPPHSVQNEAQRGQTTHPGAGAEPLHPRGGTGMGRAGRRLGRGPLAALQSFCTALGAVSGLSSSGPPMCLSLSPPPLWAHGGQVSLCLLSTPGAGRESERVSRSVSERQNPCHTQHQQSTREGPSFRRDTVGRAWLNVLPPSATEAHSG